MKIVIKVTSASHADGGKAIDCALKALGSDYSVEILEEDRSFGGNGSSITYTGRLTDLPVNDPDPDGLSHWGKQLGMAPISVDALQGFTTGFAIDPLESAIGTVASIITDHPACADRLNKHLDDLLALQLKRLDQ